ncbi:MAG: hypothetical protein J5818_07050, partial [Eggerthellaceae bacterium]|nr:hypothetical protein [Eggerthellaceae bacterium]
DRQIGETPQFAGETPQFAGRVDFSAPRAYLATSCTATAGLCFCENPRFTLFDVLKLCFALWVGVLFRRMDGLRKSAVTSFLVFMATSMTTRTEAEGPRNGE